MMSAGQHPDEFDGETKPTIQKMDSEYSISSFASSQPSEPYPVSMTARRFVSDPGMSTAKTVSPMSLSQTDVDPELLKLQIEWADLLMNDDLVIDIPPKCDLNLDKQQLLAARWFDDGVVGWKIDYPQTEFELKCYRISRSRRFLQIYTLVFFLHMCSPFVGEPYCPWEFYKDNEKVSLVSTAEGHFLPRVVVNLFDLCCILLYLFDIVLRLVVNNGKNRVRRLPFYKDKWILIRLVCTTLLFVDCVVFLITRQPIRFARALIPLIYIARRNSMRQMVHGLMNAFLKSTSILTFLVLVHLFWSYLGFVIFRGVDVSEGDRFYDFPTTMLTVLQCVASRSFSVFALTPYYDVNPTAALFFLALTIAADLICINLIVAVGNRQYKLFSGTLYKRQLRNRRQAFVAIHDLLADDRGFVSRETWLGFCSHIQGKYSVSRKAADLLFSLECEKNNDKSGFDCVDCVGFFRLSALLSARIDIDVDKVNPTGSSVQGDDDDNEDEDEDEENIPSGYETEMEGHVGGVGSAGGTLGVLSEENLSSRKSGETYSGDGSVHENPLHNDTIFPDITGVNGLGIEGLEAARAGRANSEPSVMSVDPAPFQKFEVRNKMHPGRALSADRLSGPLGPGLTAKKHEVLEKRRTRLEFRPRAESALLSKDDDTDINNIDEMELLSASTNSLNSPYVQFIYSLRLKTVQMIKYSIPLQRYLPPQLVSKNSTSVFSPYDCFFFMVKVALAVQLVFMSRRTNTLVWIRLGWFLEALLWLEMLLFMFAWGFSIYLRRGGFGYVFSLNIITLIVMILMGPSASETYSTSFFLLLIFQSCRYLVFFRYLADANLFISLVPLLFRVLFIILCVVYFFAVIGHNRLCNVFNPDNIDDQTDDDASTWLNFEQMFNFNSLLQTMYTLFYVAMLGNWTWIMDAAARTERVPSLLYFYSFRLLMTLVVIPIMFAFIIQSYIAKRDKEEKSKGSDEIRLSDHLRIVGTYQFEAPTPSAVGEEPISDTTIDRALQRAESRRTIGSSGVSEADRSVTSYQMEGADVSGGTSKIRSEKDAIRRWNQGALSVQAMFEAYALGLLFPDEDTRRPVNTVAGTGAVTAQDSSPQLARTQSDASVDRGSVENGGKVKGKSAASVGETTYQVKEGEKSASMMTFWSGGTTGVMQKASSEKDKKRAEILERMVEETLNQILIEKGNLSKLDNEFDTLQASRRPM